MGYSTEFKGELKFTKPLTSTALGHLNAFLDKDRRDIGLDGDEMYTNGYGTYWEHIDYVLLDDFSGIQWNGAEKSYDMEHIANFLIDTMKEKFPDFGLTGKMVAQGDDPDDRWELVIKDGYAVKVKADGSVAEICPHCGGGV